MIARHPRAGKAKKRAEQDDLASADIHAQQDFRNPWCSL